MNISLIAAIDKQNGIGKDNELLYHLPADLKYFKKCTMGKPIVMGFNTFQSISRALPGRRNIVLSRKQRQLPEGVELCHDFQQALGLCQGAEEVMIIGGATIYQQAIAVATKLYITKIDHSFDADVFFPEISEKTWELVSQEKHAKYSFNLYTRRT